MRRPENRFARPAVAAWLVATAWMLAGPRAAVSQEPDRPGPAHDGGAIRLGQPAEVYRERREAVRKGVNEALAGGRSSRIGLILLRGADAPELEGKFRQSNDFAYLTGLGVPGAYLLLRLDSDQVVVYLPPDVPGAGLFTPERPLPGEAAAEAFGVDRVESTGRLLADLFGRIGDPIAPTREGSAAVVFVRGPRPDDDARDVEARLIRLLRQGAPNTEFRDLRPILTELRQSKSDSEIALLRTAIGITGRALDHVASGLGPDVHEYELEGTILGTFLRAGAERAGFASIVGSGPNSVIPHYFENTRRMGDGDLVVVDIGAEYRLYTADVTRTFPVSGRFTPRQREVYQLVLDAQRAAEAEVVAQRPSLDRLTGFVRGFFERSPLRSRDREGVERTMDHFFVHGLGHYLGMDVHDVGRTDRPLRPGEVFTIEPGLYLPSEGFGVRIEDDYLLTSDGLQKLSGAIPSDPEAVEHWIEAEKAGLAP